MGITTPPARPYVTTAKIILTPITPVPLKLFEFTKPDFFMKISAFEATGVTPVALFEAWHISAGGVLKKAEISSEGSLILSDLTEGSQVFSTFIDLVGLRLFYLSLTRFL